MKFLSFLFFSDRAPIISVHQRSDSERYNQARSFLQPANSLLGLGSVLGEEMVSTTKYHRADIEVFLDCHPKWRK
jgi:hypothetical protein